MEFIKVHDATKISNNLMVIRSEDIFKIEEAHVSQEPARLITFTNGSYEFVTESMDHLLNMLVGTRTLNS